MCNLTVGLDVTTNTGYAIYNWETLTVGRVSSKSAYKQYSAFLDVMFPLMTKDRRCLDIVIEKFIAFNGPNPKTNAMLAGIVGGWEALCEQHQATYSNVSITLAHVKTVRASFRKEGKQPLTKLEIRDTCRKITGLTLSDDETDAIAMVFWKIKKPLTFLEQVNVVVR